MIRVTAETLLLLSLVTVPHNAMAHTDPAAACQAAKLTATGKEAGSELTCHAKAAKTGVTVDPSCLGKAKAALASSFTKADAKGGCPTTRDSRTVDSVVGVFVGNVLGALRPSSTLSHCAAAELATVGKAASSLLVAEAKNVTKPDAGKLSSAISKLYRGLNKAFTKAEASKTPDCLTTGKGPHIWLAISSQDFKVRNLLLVSPTTVTFNNYPVPQLPAPQS